MAKKSPKFQHIDHPKFKPELIIPIGHTEVIYSVCFSPDGLYALSGSLDHSVKLWEIKSGREIRTFYGHENGVTSVCFSPDGRHALSGSHDRTMKLWDILTGQVIRTFKGHEQAVMSVCFSPDSKSILSGSMDTTLRLWFPQESYAYRSLEGHTSMINSVSFSPDGRYILSGSEDNTIKIWEHYPSNKTKTFYGHNSGVKSVCFSPDGRSFLSGSDDGTIKLWDISKGISIRSFEGHFGRIKSVCFSPDGRNFLSSSESDQVKLWDNESGEVIMSFFNSTGTINSLCFSPDGFQALSGDRDKTIKLWDIQKQRVIRTFKSLANWVISVCISPDGQYALEGCFDTTIKLWDIQKGQLIRSFKGHTGYIETVKFSPDGRYALSGSDDNTLKLWDIQKGQLIRSFLGHTECILSVSFSPDGQFLVSGSADNTLKLWNTKTGHEIHSFEGHTGYIDAVSFSPDGCYISSASYDNTIKLWDIHTLQLVKSFEGHIDLVTCVSFSSDGQHLLSGAADGTIKLWDIGTGKERKSFKVPLEHIHPECFSPDLKYVVLLGVPSQLKLWDIEAMHEVHSYEGHTGRINSVCFTTDGTYVLTGSDDCAMRLWDVQLGHKIASLISLDSDDWIITTPAGLFDASEGALTKIHYTIGLETIGFDQLVGRYHVPGLLPFLLGDEKIEVFDVPPIEKVKLHPKLQVGIKGDNLIVDLENRGGGIGRVMVFVEDIEFIIDARGKPLKDESRKKLTLRIDLRKYQQYFIPGKPNPLTIFCENQHGTLRSKPVHLTYTPQSLVSRGEAQLGYEEKAMTEEKTRPIKMHAVFIAANTKGSGKNPLEYAENDAESMAQIFNAAGDRLFGSEATSTVLKGKNLTKERIREEFAQMERLEPEDIVVVFLSGHATTQGAFKEYYYLLRDSVLAPTFEEIISNPEICERCTLTLTELRELVNKIPARKKILILDTCRSGHVAGQFGTARSLTMESYSQAKVIGDVRRSTGFCILSGCSEDKESFEYAGYRHGLMTYSILLGISTGEGLFVKDGREYIEPMSLFSYVKARTERLADRMNQMQKPQISIPESLAGELLLGEVTQSEKKLIKLSGLKLFAPSRINPENALVYVDLDSQLDAILKSKDQRDVLQYTERTGHPEVYQIWGTYRMEQSRLIIRCWLTFGGKSMKGSERIFKLAFSEIDHAAAKIFRELFTVTNLTN